VATFEETVPTINSLAAATKLKTPNNAAIVATVGQLKRRITTAMTIHATPVTRSNHQYFVVE
jgi:hypothetical protein